MNLPPITLPAFFDALNDGELECLAGRLFEKRDRHQTIRLALLMLTAVYYSRTRRRLTFKTDARYLIYAPPSGLPVFRADEKQDVRERIISQEQGPDRFIVRDTRTATRQPGGSLDSN